MDRLIVTTVTLGKGQVEFIRGNCNNVSRYIRSLIDREMGAQRAVACQVVSTETCYNSNTKQKPQPKTLDWNRLK